MAPGDTTAKANEIYWRRLAEMTPSERLRIAADLWEAGHKLQLAGMRHSFPDAGEDEILFRIAVTRFGADLARKVYRRT